MKYYFLSPFIVSLILVFTIPPVLAEGGGGIDCPENSGTFYYVSGSATYEENPFDEGQIAVLFCHYQTDVIDVNNLEIFGEIHAIFHLKGELSQELIDEYGCGSVLGEQYESKYLSSTSHFVSVAYSTDQLIDAAEIIMSQIKENNLATSCEAPEKKPVVEVVKEIVEEFEEDPENFLPEDIVQDDATIGLEIVLPDWIKNNALWWSTDQITSNDFSLGIEFMINEGFIKIPPTEAAIQKSNEIPDWIKNNAGWWAEGLISDNEFVNGLQFLISNGIINVS